MLQLPTLEEIEAEERRRGIEPSPCLWPAPYNEDTIDAAMAFMFDCRTWDPTDSALKSIPNLPHLEQFASLWFEAKQTGGTLIVPRQTRTNSFGNFTFEDVEVGQIYILSVQNKKYGFQQTSLIVSVLDNIGDIIFQAAWEN